MKKLKIFFVAAVFFQSTVQNPVDVDSVHKITDIRVENKNWKLKAGSYDNTSENSATFNDPPNTYRLPNNTFPLRYDIFLRTDVDKNDFNFYGRVKIRVQAVETTDTVTLQYRDLTVTQVSLLNSNGQVLDDNLQVEYVEPKSYEFLKISLPRLMNATEIFILELTYNGILNTKQAGFYRAFFFDGSRTVYYGTTQFESTDARHAFPCYDEPHIRTTFGLQIQHDRSYSAFSNMDLMDQTPITGTNYVVSRFQDTPSMQTYLLAFLVAPFEYISNNNTETPQRIIAKPSSIRNGEAEFAVAITDPILRKLESHIGIKYNLPKLDHAAITQFEAGAMENWGLVTYREIALLFAPTGLPSFDEALKSRIIMIMAHEDAHQFFGNLVAPHWWTDLWLNEGLATLYQYYIPHLLYPDDGYMDRFRTSEVSRAFNADESNSVPLSHYVESPKDIESRFDDISYSKGGAVLRMFQEAISVPSFTKGLKKYLNKMAYKSATPSDLFGAIQEAADEDFSDYRLNIASIMGTWIYQAGYPIISVSRRGNNLVFRQRRYPNGGKEIYAVPLTFATKSEPNFEAKTARFLLTESETELSFESLRMDPNDWIILNNHQVGYYRTSYSHELWHKIAAALQDDYSKIHLVSREVLLSDLNIAYNKLEELYASDVLEVIFYIINEPESSIWDRADHFLNELSLKLYGTDIFDKFLKYLKHITRTQLEHIGIIDLDGEPSDRALMRYMLRHYNCYALDDLCLDHETKILELYIENNDYPAPDFCVALRNADIKTYVYFLNELVSNADARNRYWIIEGISCALKKTHLEILVSTVEYEKNELSSFERVRIIENMMLSSAIGLDVAFEYLERNLEKISNFTFSIKQAVNAQKYADKLDILLDDALMEDFITLESAKEVRDAVQNNLKWQERHFTKVVEWFKDFDERIIPTESPTNIPTTTEDGSANGVFVSVFLIAFMVLSMRIIG